MMDEKNGWSEKEKDRMCRWLHWTDHDSGRERTYMAGYQFGHEAGRKEGYEEGYSECSETPCECDASSYRLQGFNEGSADKAKAVKAEHEHTMADLEAALYTWRKRYPGGLIDSVLFVREQMRSDFLVRTKPKPHMVTVRMPESTYKDIVTSVHATTTEPLYPDVELVDPPGENKESSCA